MSKDNVQISPRQLTFLIITLVISTADLFLPAFVAQEAKKDSWISAILATVFTVLVTWVLLKLYKQHEGKTLIQIIMELTGKPIGTILGLIYVFFFFQSAFGVVMGMVIMMNTAFLPLTPSWVLIIVTILVSMYAVSKDIEVIARINEILLPLGIGAFALLMLVNVKDIDLTFFLPILNEGVIPPLQGALIILGIFCEIVVVMQLIPYTGRADKLNRAVYSGVIISGGSILGGTLVYALFGPLTEVFLMPALEFARIASFGEYIQNLDILVMAIWITGIYVKIIVFYYAGTSALTQVFKLKGYKALVLPAGILLTSLSLATESRIVEMLYFLHYIHSLLSLTVALVIPGFLLMVSTMKKDSKGKKAGNRSEVRRNKKKEARKKEENAEEISGRKPSEPDNSMA